MQDVKNNQIAEIEKLYENGQYNGASLTEILDMSEPEVDELIGRYSKEARGAYQPLTEFMRQTLEEMVMDGEVDLTLSDIKFMTMEDAETYLLTKKFGKKVPVRMCTLSQYHTMKRLMDKGCLKKMEDWLLRLSSYEEARQLISEGERRYMPEE